MLTMTHPNTRKSLRAAAKVQLEQAANLANVLASVIMEPGTPDPLTVNRLHNAIQAAKDQAQRLEILASDGE